jgi:hypothetical protein
LDWVSGQIQVPVKITVLDQTQTLVTPSYSAVGLSLILGVTFKMPVMGPVLSIEGAYNTLGAHYMGLMAGVHF